MHLKRWITSVVAVPLLVLLIYKGGESLFALFIGILCVFALVEYFRLVFTEKIFGIIPLLGFFIGPAIIFAARANSSEIISGLITINMIAAGFISVLRYKFDSSVLDIISKQVQGIIYIPLLLSYLVLIRNGIDGISWIFLLLCVVFAGDTGAYYIGSYFGRHKLCPAVSPGKTIEGSIGGLTANVAIGALIKSFFMPQLSWGLSILFFILVGIVGQAGDLFESELKRSGDAKDSGTIFPGHGGVLDRIDSLLFAAPLAYLFKEYLLR
ncbi:MAG: phosphatidate cytidylyltransferase [Deltaproteobacteria bacterium]|nr:phosphatidate cytidylyltransferase [Deltaproteobacteria bacterium]